MMKISKEGLDLIKRCEGLRLEPYICPAGVLTIGYGHTRGVKHTDLITEIKASQYLVEDVKFAEEAIRKYVKVELKQCQFDALCDFIFNLGEYSFKGSTLLRRINARATDTEICNEFRKWTKVSSHKMVNGRWTKIYVSLEGLEKRREEEVKLWLNHLKK